MEKQINPQEILVKLARLQAQVDKLQEDFEDSILSDDDVKALKLVEEEYKNGELVSLEDIKKLREQNVRD